MSINAFIFSRNRACQLRLLLESLAVNSPQLFRPYILYKADPGPFSVGYAKLQAESAAWFSKATWVLETDTIKEEFQAALQHNRQDTGLTAMFTDDCIMYRVPPPSFGSMIHQLFNSQPKLMCFSLRLGDNCYIQNHRTGEVHGSLENSPIKLGFRYWNARHYAAHSNLGYLFGQDGCCYRSADLLEVLSNFEELKAFRDFEGCLSEPSRQPIKDGKTYMASFQQSIVVNFPLNTVQTDAVGTQAMKVVSLADLNARYLRDEVIDLRSFDFTNVRGCHQEFNFDFKKINEEVDSY